MQDTMRDATAGTGGDAARFVLATEADPAVLRGHTIAVLGYGNLGRSMALNLRDAGLDLVIGNIDDGYRAAAGRDGFEVLDPAAATRRADLVFVLLPDEVIPGCFASEVGPHLQAGAAVCFASGYVLAFGLVEPPPQADVLLFAPRMVGSEVRSTYLDGSGFLSYLSVEQDATGRGWPVLTALAHAAGSLQRGAMVLPARQEAVLDLFIEQGVGPYLGIALQLAFTVGTEAGLPPEARVLEMYMSGEMARTVQGFADEGFYQSVTGHGLVATYGGFLGTLGLDVEDMQRRFTRTLESIRSGEFARKLQDEQANGYPTLAAIEQATALDNPITAAERRVRAALARR
ncbi:MAG: NAD(P)-binding domain-containing protein [Carbonactinosporaceae bacterium]